MQSNKNSSKIKTNPWNDVIKKVLDRKEKGYSAALLCDKACEAFYANTKQKYIPKKSLQTYSLGMKHRDVSFSRGEAECMAWLLKSKKTKEIATLLKLSDYTVGKYIKKMKIKVGCDSEAELINLVKDSEFIKSVDF